MEVYLVIDIGTTSVRGIVYDSSFKEMFKRQLKTAPEYHGDIVEQRVEIWDQAIEEILSLSSNYIAHSKNDLLGVIVTSQRSSLICLDENGQALLPAIMWQDKRSNKVVSEFNNYNQFFIERTGSRINPVYLGPKILYVKKNLPSIFKKTHKFLSIADYVRFKLTGDYITDYTYASRTSLFNLEKQDWDNEILELFGIERENLCELEYPGQQSSIISEEICKKYKLPLDLPYISAGGDQQCSAVGTGVHEEGDLSVTLGTGGYLLAPSNKFIPTNQLIYNHHSLSGLYLTEGIIITAASMLDYFKSTYYPEVSDKEFYDLISKVLQNNQTNEIIHLPYYQGRGTPDWNTNAKAAYLNMTFATTREDLLVAVIESIGFEVKQNIDNYEEIFGNKIKQIFLTGGLSKNVDIVKMLSDILRRTVNISIYPESTALGALLVGMQALKKDFYIEKAYKTISQTYESYRYLPNLTKEDYYMNKMAMWESFYSKLYEEDSNEVC